MKVSRIRDVKMPQRANSNDAATARTSYDSATNVWATAYGTTNARAADAGADDE